jgi:hypothetical protein
MSASNTGILTLGSSGSTTRLNAPLTPLYNYPIGAATAPNTPSIGTAGTIGFIPATTFITNTIGEGGSGGAGISVRSTVLTAGTWILYGFFKMPDGVFTQPFSVIFSTAANQATNEVGRKGTQQIQGNFPTMSEAMTTTAFVTPTATTTYYFNIRSFFASATIERSVLIAVRVA